MFDPHFGVRDKPLAVILTASGFAVGAREVLIKHQLSLPRGIFQHCHGALRLGLAVAFHWPAIPAPTFHSPLNVLQI